MKNEKEVLSQLVGLKVTRTWVSVGSWLWIELGELKESGEYNSLRGQFTLEIACPWELVLNENGEKTLIDSESKHPFDDDDVFAFLKDKELLSFHFFQNEDGSFISIFFSENHCLKIQLAEELEFSIHSQKDGALLEYLKSGFV